MPVFFNPAATLAANRIPHATGGGGLADESASLRRTAAGKLRVGDTAAAGLIEFARGSDGGATAHVGWRDNATSTIFELRNGSSAGEIRILPNHADGNGFVTVYQNGTTEAARFAAGELRLGKSTSDSNGRLQIVSHTTAAGGIGFGSDASLFRSGAQALSVTAAPASALALRNITISTDAPPTPWTGADGDIWLQREA